MDSIIILAASKKEAKGIAFRQNGESCKFIKPYRYVSPGNNFYEFETPDHEGIFIYPDDVWPSRFWNKERTQFNDLSGKDK